MELCCSGRTQLDCGRPAELLLLQGGGGATNKEEGGQPNAPLTGNCVSPTSLRCQGNARQQLPTLGDVFKSQEREGEKVILPFRCPSDPSVSERGPKPQSRKPFHYRGTLMKKAFAEVCVAKKKVSGRLQ